MERARRYRTALIWTEVVSWIAFVAFWVVLIANDFEGSNLDLVLLATIIASVPLHFFFQARISKAIGRKWTLRHEMKEKQEAQPQPEPLLPPIPEPRTEMTPFDAREIESRTSELIGLALPEVSDLMGEAFREVGGEPQPGSALDQAGLRDGQEIVTEYLEAGEPGEALEHLIYMVSGPELPISDETYRMIEDAGLLLKMDPAMWESLRPTST